jgi:Tol biopolymer transport system component
MSGVPEDRSRVIKAVCYGLLPAILFCLAGCRATDLGQHDPDLFGIYTATLGGQNMTLVVSDPTREMTHPRISPDKKWITFTRFNKPGPGGLAEETGGYQRTEIMIVRVDGTGLETLVPPKMGISNVNSSWTPDGQSIIYVSTDNADRIAQIYKMNLARREVTRVPTPEGLYVTDPRQVGDWFVFPARKGHPKGLWVMRSDGTEVRQLTYPDIPEPGEKTAILLGDYDPRFSPDGTKVAFMRYYGGKEWHVIVVDVETGNETDLTAPLITGEDVVAEGMVHWTSDGRLLVFRHIELPRIENVGLYTMKPDGTERKMIPLPRGYFYGSTATCFPGEGSSPQTRIVFHAKKDSRF